MPKQQQRMWYQFGVPKSRLWLTRPTLSVLCPTGHPGALVATLLEGLRGVADEIIIAANITASESDLAEYAAIADVVVRYEHCGSNNHWPWLTEQARGDWLLIIDGDEMPSATLVEALPDLLADRRIAQYSLPIHWLWRSRPPRLAWRKRKSTLRRLAQEPWSSDRRLRLLRNDGRLLFGVGLHTLAQAAPPIAYRDDLPVYHLDLLLPDRERRVAKVAKYDAQHFGLLTAEGDPFNRAFYVPEASRDKPRLADIPAVDSARVERALVAQPKPGRSLNGATVPLADRATILRSASGAAVREPNQRGEITITNLPTFTAQRPDNVVWVEVVHRGTVRWPGVFAVGPKIHIVAGWRPVAGGPIQEVGRTPLPHALDPGETVLVPVVVASAPPPGDVDLVIDLIDDSGRWFGCAATARVTVLPSAAERLAQIEQRHGALLPLSAISEARRSVGRRDGLLLRTADGNDTADRPPSDPRLAELAAGLTLGGWALDGPTVDRLAELVGERRPRTVVEFGSGTGTILLAALMSEQGSDSHVISVEQDEALVTRTRDELAGAGLDHVATLVHLPVGAVGEGVPMGYVLSEEAALALRTHPPELIFVDGPTLDSGASRLGTVDVVAPFVRDDAVLLLNDAFRDAELCVAAAWNERTDITIHGYRATTKGLLEATLRYA